MAAAVVAFAAVALIVALSSDSDEPAASSGDQVGMVAITGDPLPRFVTPGADDPALGRSAPAVEGSSFEGAPVAIDTDDDLGDVIVFFAHWCPHCQRELPRLTSWLEENELPSNVEVTGVSTAVDPTAGNFPPSEWFESVGWPQPVLRDSSSAATANAYGLSGYPYTVVVDDSGSVAARISGELTIDQWEALVAVAAGEGG